VLLLFFNSLYSSLLRLQEVIIPGVIQEFWFSFFLTWIRGKL